MRSSIGAATAVVLALFAVSGQAATTTVVPAAQAAAEGNQSHAFPFNVDLVDPAGGRFQAAIPQSMLGGLPVGASITGIQFRTDSTVSSISSQTIANVEIRLSTSANAPGSLSTTFANNRGADQVIARSGPLTINATDYPTGSSPNAFGPVITFSTPFQYKGGTLLLEMATTTMTNGFLVDAQTGTAARLAYGNGFNATTAFTANGTGLQVVQLTLDTSTVPALNGWTLAALAMILGATGIIILRQQA